jgi:hypothetical protein
MCKWLDKQTCKSVFEVAMKLRADEYEQLRYEQLRADFRAETCVMCPSPSSLIR